GTPGGDYTIDTNTYTNIQIPEDAKSFSIESNGTVNYIDKDDELVVAGKIALASFSNRAGLNKAGNNLYLSTDNAGLNVDDNGNIVPIEAENGNDTSFISGKLEMSNVDLAEEFTEMITAQRGFQANTRIITTSDEILQEL